MEFIRRLGSGRELGEQKPCGTVQVGLDGMDDAFGIEEFPWAG
jgi:hypothetical protein